MPPCHCAYWILFYWGSSSHYEMEISSIYVCFRRSVGGNEMHYGVNIQNSSWNQLFQSSPAQLNSTFWNLWENRNSERIFHARKENVNIPCGTAQTLERIFEFIDQNVKKNTLNSNDVQWERERERELSLTSGISQPWKNVVSLESKKCFDWMNIILL